MKTFLNIIGAFALSIVAFNAGADEYRELTADFSLDAMCTQTTEVPMIHCRLQQDAEDRTKDIVFWCMPKFFGIVVPGDKPFPWVCTKDRAKYQAMYEKILDQMEEMREMKKPTTKKGIYYL